MFVVGVLTEETLGTPENSNGNPEDKDFVR